MTSRAMTSQESLARAQYWASAAVFDQKTRAEIGALISAKNDKEIEERFWRDLEFGTGGLRGIIGAGTSRMNIYNVRKASYALALYLREQNQNAGKGEIRVAISYDSRNFSREFAQAAAEVFAGAGIKVFITKEMRPVPMLSFAVRHFNCHAGVCVTASHNPPEYNGYKVYWRTGGQIIAPHDAAVINQYRSISSYEDVIFTTFAGGKASGLIVEVGEELDSPYFAEVDRLSVRKGGRENFKIVYTPLHGSGLYPVTDSLRRFGFKDVLVVPEQSKPDGSFPTVQFPNPEDPAALAMAIKLAQATKADLVLGTDPDTDRIGIVVREGDQFVILNGNQIGCLLVDFFLSGMRDGGRLPANPLVIKTIVTTEMQRDIARHYGADCEDTLTGFKWICDLVDAYESGRLTPRKTYVCGGEESYGFLAGTFVRDKDAVSACCIAAEMVAWYKSQGKTLSNRLDELYQLHGVYLESLHTLTLPGKDGSAQIRAMMQQLRTQPPSAIDGVPVVRMLDFELRQEFLVTSGKLEKTNDLRLPRSDVLQFVLNDETRVSVRPSGTEPKIKFYVSVRDLAGRNASLAKLETIKAHCRERLQRIESTFVAMAR